MAALILGRRILSTRKNLFKTPRRKESGYIVLLPEIGEDLPDKNPLIKEASMLPDFNNASVEKCITITGKQSLEFEQGVKAVENHITDSENIDVIKDVIEPIEKLEIPLQTTWGISKVLYFGSQSRMPTNSYINIHKRAWAAISWKYNSKIIYETFKKKTEDMKDLTEEEKQIVLKYVLEGRFNGLDLKGKNKDLFKMVTTEIVDGSNVFGKKLEAARRVFKHKVTDANIMKGFPEDFLKSVAADPAQYNVGPWFITLKPQIVQTFLEYCPDSLLRWNIWQANSQLCSNFRENEVENCSLVNGISADRNTMAKYLGFKNYVEMCMCTKMAGSLKNVEKFLDNLLEAAFPCQEKEIEKLMAFAKERGYDKKLDQWDIAYWARKQKFTLYNYDEEMLKEYFPLTKVMEGVFQLIKNLFNVEIVEREDVDVWHKDVRFFDVYDLDVSTSEAVGSFYFDPYARDEEEPSYNRNSGWVILLRNKSDYCGTKPLSSLIFNFQPPEKGHHSYISFTGVQSIFENFGQLLQQVLTRVKSAEVAGLSNISWDAAGTSKYFLGYWVYDKQILKNISSHQKTGEPLSDEIIQNLANSRTHMSGFNTCKELYLSKYDIMLHTENLTWERIMKKLWPQHFVLPEDKRDSHVCSWEAIFVDNLGGAYYSDLWSKMLAADVYSAFQECQSNDEEWKKVGSRFKNTFLTLGGSIPMAEVFRRFRGRDPSLKALIKNLNFT